MYCTVQVLVCRLVCLTSLEILSFLMLRQVLRTFQPKSNLIHIKCLFIYIISAFHEAVGDTISLSVTTPKHLRAVGLITAIDDEGRFDLITKNILP